MAQDTNPSAAARTPAQDRLHRAGAFAAHEARRFFWMFLYLWVLFGLFGLYHEMVLNEAGIHFVPFGVAVVNALVLGKVMLVAEDLKLGHRIRPRPLIVPIILDSLILAVLFVVVHVLEHVIAGVIAGESVQASVPHMGGAGFPGLLVVGLILFVAMVPFFGFRHVREALGPERMHALLFGDGGSAAR